jgi:hypothetical protein
MSSCPGACKSAAEPGMTLTMSVACLNVIAISPVVLGYQ